MRKTFLCSKCGWKILDIRQLPVHCICGHTSSSMSDVYLTDIDSKSSSESNIQILKARGYGIPQVLDPLPPPEKPTDLPLEVLQWLEDQEQ